jgi:RNA polymerase sigma-70 factor, ECF subfamily
MPAPRDHEQDQRLVAAANRGDAEAFDALYERYAEWAHGLALRFTGDAADAADVVQEVFLYLLRKFPGFELRARLTTFLYPAIKHEAQAQRRKRGRHASDEQALLAAPAPRQTQDDDPRGQLLGVLASLPETQREVLLLRYVDGLSEAEIAVALGVPQGTVKSRAHTALAALRADPRTRIWFEDSGPG